MKYLECKPCEYFSKKAGGKRKTLCTLNDDGEGDVNFRVIIWCKIFEDRFKSYIPLLDTYGRHK